MYYKNIWTKHNELLKGNKSIFHTKACVYCDILTMVHHKQFKLLYLYEFMIDLQHIQKPNLD